MGVIKQARDLGVNRNNRSEYIEESIETSVTSNNLPQTSQMVSSPSPIRKKTIPAKKWFAEYRKWENTRNIKKGSGAKQHRRSENLNFLLNMAEQDEVGECELVDIVEPQLSAFAELFKEQEKMKIWNDFINRSEDEQERLLNQKGKLLQCEDSDADDDIEVIGADDSWEQIEDDRAVHPAFSAEECFRRIDQNLKCLLKKKHLPVGHLIHLEKDVIGFFTEWPNSVYVSRLENGFERMLLHALCQYLDLYSHSFNDSQGERQTQVENPHECFLPPDVSLSEFIEAKSNKH